MNHQDLLELRQQNQEAADNLRTLIAEDMYKLEDLTNSLNDLANQIFDLQNKLDYHRRALNEIRASKEEILLFIPTE